MSTMNGNYQAQPPNPKRGRHGEEFLDAEQASKKPRFDYRNPSTLAPQAPDDTDAILELDEIGKKGQQSKRSGVRLEGYDSDSSDDNFDQRAQEKAASARQEQKKNSGPSKDELENDMFADLEEEDGDDDEDKAKEGKPNKKAVRFLEQDEIEGQVHSSTAGGHVSANFSAQSNSKEVESSSDDSEGGEEERARVDDGDDAFELGAGSKKRHAPKLDSFNLRNEREEGAFDENGNFIRNATDVFSYADAWLAESSKKDMKRAKEAEAKREEERRRRDLADDAMQTSDILAQLIPRLEVGETALEALARLGASKAKKTKKKQKWQRNKRKDQEMEVDEVEQADDPSEKKRKEDVEAITAAADRLMTRGDLEVYEAERGALMRQYRRETGKDWVDRVEDGGEASASMWEYKWPNAGDVHGPFDVETMKSWNAAGYFSGEVLFRAVGTSEWSNSPDFQT